MPSFTRARGHAAAFAFVAVSLMLAACASGSAPAQKKVANGPAFEIEGDPGTSQELADLMCGAMSGGEAVMVKQGAAMSSFQCVK